MSSFALNQDQIGSFWEHGYLKLGPVLNCEEVELLREEYDRVFLQARAEKSYRNLSAKASAQGGEAETAASEMFQIMQVCERSLPFRRLLYDPRLLDPLESLVGGSIMLFHDQALFKPAHTGGPVYWHQDNAYWRCTPPNLVSCWLTLDDVDGANGAMQVIPGSHRRALDHEPSAAAGALLDLGSRVESSRAVVVDLPAGGCMFHHCQTLHYTAPNETDRQRRAWAVHFMASGTRDGSGNIMHVSFARPLLRLAV